MKIASVTVPIDELEECSETMRRLYLETYWAKQQKPFKVGDRFVYLELRIVSGKPRFVNCTITVREGEQRP